MTFGRLVHFFHPERRCVGLKALSIAAGGMMLNPGSDDDVQKIGLKVYMAGVGVQEGSIMSKHCVCGSYIPLIAYRSCSLALESSSSKT